MLSDIYSILALKTMLRMYKMIKCDMIKRNESDVGDVVFEILAKTVFKSGLPLVRVLRL